MIAWKMTTITMEKNWWLHNKYSWYSWYMSKNKWLNTTCALASTISNNNKNNYKFIIAMTITKIKTLLVIILLREILQMLTWLVAYCTRYELLFWSYCARVQFHLRVCMSIAARAYAWDLVYISLGMEWIEQLSLLIYVFF